MNKRQLTLDDLKVKSFCTAQDKEQKIKVQGASGGPAVCTNYYLCTWDGWTGCVDGTEYCF